MHNNIKRKKIVRYSATLIALQNGTEVHRAGLSFAAMQLQTALAQLSGFLSIS